MPHLDEGALWVRATAPYTISFEEASKLSPQIRDILSSFPQVTTVANELGRPDDGTDPTGFFNNEFYVGLKPYDDKAWSGPIHHKPELIEAVQKKVAAFPGVIFNFTQPAEDAVDEAETGLKSALAVKIFGSDLATLEDKARQTREILTKIPGITEITVVRELGQPTLIISPDRAKLARYGLNVSDGWPRSNSFTPWPSTRGRICGRPWKRWISPTRITNWRWPTAPPIPPSAWMLPAIRLSPCISA